ncbi:hypothetical protein [Labrenzia sp. DG1229]|uniref:hypothetical protein n=1 Tax=Labrenzia sp. DG1229 TaxID=681847 RepID=UPI0012EBE31B|nr:hypothetical protein [Labrenzia sp. DG1229]
MSNPTAVTSIIGKLFIFLLKKVRFVSNEFVLLASVRMSPDFASVSEPFCDTETVGGMSSHGIKPTGPKKSNDAAPLSLLMSVTEKL